MLVIYKEMITEECQHTIKAVSNTTMKLMENKQTAVEWLVKELNKMIDFIPMDKWDKIRDIVQQAKEMEKEQHGKTWDDALAQVEKRTVWARAMCDFDEYYEETYKK
jgi:hypothetical protein